jgi:hypothetical protein
LNEGKGRHETDSISDDSLALATAGILIMGLLPATAASAKKPVPHGNRAGGYGGGIANGVPLPPGPPPLVGGSVTLTHSHNNGGTVTLQKSQVTQNHVDNCEATNSIAGCTS